MSGTISSALFAFVSCGSQVIIHLGGSLWSKHHKYTSLVIWIFRLLNETSRRVDNVKYVNKHNIVTNITIICR